MAKILVTEDDKYIVKWARQLLENNLYDVITACSGEEAITKAKEEKPDLILLDIMMPQPDGYEVLKRLKADEATNAIPVIMVSARVGNEDVTRCAGKDTAAGFITKPYTPESLLSMVEKVLKDA